MPSPRKKYTRFLCSHFELMMRIIPSTNRTTGSSNTHPKPITISSTKLTSALMSARYVVFGGENELSTWRYSGSANSATATPIAKKKIVATISGRMKRRSCGCSPGLTNHQTCWMTTGAAMITPM